MQHWPLLLQLIRRDVQARYRGSALGMAWSFVIPLLMLGVYTFVFAIVFKARWGSDPSGAEGGTLDFALNLYAGLILHGFLAENLSRAPTLITSNANYVTKVVFPLAILPPMLLGSALFHLAVNLGVLLLALLCFGPAVPPTLLLAPLLLLPLAVFALGVNYFLASLGVFLRDIGQLMGLAITLLMFLSPIFYPVTALPDFLQSWILLNPLTLPVEWLRGLLMEQRLPEIYPFAVYAAFAMLTAAVGRYWFLRTRGAFADVL